ncbi:MAG: hypothetical protein L6Q76_27600 [Polyangiaceae bacterium]|nr:hypothetical protein [Polyangiaceae bacterium]
MPPRTWIALLAVPVIGLAELAAHLYFAKAPPAFDAWSEIREPVAAIHKPGDLVVTAPHWAEPLARRALGDDLMPLRDTARPDASRYASAIEISILGERSDELSGWTEESRETHGKFVIRRLRNPAPAPVVFDFTDHTLPPFADVRGTEPPVSCVWNERAQILAGGLGGHPTFPRRRFECPGGPFFNVGVTVIADQDFRPRRCIWSHPLARGEIVTRYRGVPLGNVIQGHAGMYWIVERTLTGAPVTLSVRVDGEPVGSFSHIDGDGWKHFVFSLGPHAGKTSAEVEFAVSTPSYHHRHYCFEADSR